MNPDACVPRAAAAHAAVAAPRSRGLGGLLVLNGALLAVLSVIEFAPRADAQTRARGEYLIVSGGVPQAQPDAVYIVDTANQEMVAVQYDPNQRTIVGIGYANLAADSTRLLATGTRPTN